MKAQITFFTILFVLLLTGCSTDANEDPIIDETQSEEMYFPPLESSTWETISSTELGWNVNAEQDLFNFLEEKNTDAIIILKNGRIVIEKYFGGFSQDDGHVWNSVGKTLTTMTVGIAQKEGLLSIDDISSEYLGTGWSSLTQEQEQNIKVKNHLTMTTGLEYGVDDIYCTDPECLIYKNEPGEFWFYHNAAYTLLSKIITGASGMDFKNYSYTKIRDKIGMQGIWLSLGFNNNYFSTARSMARFGLLNLNQGVWNGEAILDDVNYFNEMVSTSQTMNQGYGYLFWLNGKENYRIPGVEQAFTGELIPNAPSDLFAGLGANDQKLYVVPSEKLVIIRMGDAAEETILGPSSFDNQLWEKINAIIN